MENRRGGVTRRVLGIVGYKAARALGLQSTAHEVDDFEAVAIFEDGFGPAISRRDLAVQFDGNAVGLHI